MGAIFGNFNNVSRLHIWFFSTMWNDIHEDYLRKYVFLLKFSTSPGEFLCLKRKKQEKLSVKQLIKAREAYYSQVTE